MRDTYDPPTATLAVVRCPECSSGDKGSDTVFRDAQGREVCNFCGRWRCERVGGTAECDERLIISVGEKP